MRFPRAALFAARLLGVVPFALLGACTRAPAELPKPPISIVLLSLDTLRADHLGCYGYARPTSPRLDALASESILFEHARTPVPWTTAAHMTMLTSLEPDVHKVTHTALAETRFTGPERLHEAGYATAGFVNATALDHRFGFTRGFDAYEYVDRQTGSAVINQKALDWLASVGDRPFFLFVHFYVVHNPYDPPEEFRAPFVSAYRAEDVARTGIGPYHPPVTFSDAERQAMIDLYDGGVRYGDHEAGVLLDGLAKLGVLDRTAVFVTSDHGEGFGEHGLYNHGNSLYEELLHVPLIVRLPGKLGAGRRVSTAVSHVDLLPTFFALAGIGDAPGLMGRSLLPALQGGALPAQPVWADGAGSQALVDGNWKVIVNGEGRAKRIPAWKSTGPTELYDLANDPGELQNLAQARPQDAQRLLERAQAIQRDHRMLAKAVATSHTELPDDVRERLKSLGYLE
ncbi:MAG: sulfatase [bacterium]